jgi:hypothetical protein
MSVEIIPTRKVKRVHDQDVPDRMRADRQFEVRPATAPNSAAVEIALQRMMKGPIPNTGPSVSPYTDDEVRRRREVWEAGGDPDVVT